MREKRVYYVSQVNHSCFLFSMSFVLLEREVSVRDDKVQKLLFLIVQSSLRIKNNNDSPGLRSKHASLS